MSFCRGRFFLHQINLPECFQLVYILGVRACVFFFFWRITNVVFPKPGKVSCLLKRRRQFGTVCKSILGRVRYIIHNMWKNTYTRELYRSERELTSFGKFASLIFAICLDFWNGKWVIWTYLSSRKSYKIYYWGA